MPPSPSLSSLPIFCLFQALRARGAEQKIEKKKNTKKKIERESGRAANLFLFFCLLNLPLLSHFRFRLLRCLRARKSGMLRYNEVSTEIIPNQISRANHLMAREVLIKNWKMLCNAEDRLIFTKFIKLCVEKVRKSSCFKQMRKRKHLDQNVWIFEPFQRTF